MDLFGLGSMMGAISDGIVGGLNYKNQKEALEEQKKQNAWANQFAEKNFDFAQKQYEEQKLREDNATQRKVADLEKAGFNKLMAAGQGASAGAGVGTVSGGGSGNFTAPQLQLGIQQSIDSIYNALKMTNDLAISEQQKNLIEAQVLGEYESQNLTREQREELNARKKETLYNLKKSQGLGLRTTDAMNSNINTVIGATNTFKEEYEDAKKRAERAKEKVKDNIGGKPEHWRGNGATYQNGRRYGY